MTSRGRYGHLQEALPDARSRQVVFLSHCLLNQNTRYLGGAVCPGVVAPAIAPYLDGGQGIVQLPCPEQRAWGGVLKNRLLRLLEHRWVAHAGPVLAPLAISYLRRRYARLARTIVDDVADYRASGCTVTGVVGVAGSPSCGVRRTLDLRGALAAIAASSHHPVSTDWMNRTVIRPAVRDGRGLFIEAVARELDRRHLDVELIEQSLEPTETATHTRPRSAGALTPGA